MDRLAIDFNPRTRVGCDFHPHDPDAGLRHFNPRTRVGCDECTAERVVAALISIHAPGWGATLETVSMHRASIYFNPRTRVGCDAAFCGCSALKTAFQSTHPHGVRLEGFYNGETDIIISIHAPAWGATVTVTILQPSKINFNPRTRMGCDGSKAGKRKRGGDFNPRTRMGCDFLQWKLGQKLLLISIHAPAWGATGLGFERSLRTGISIHAPAWGATSKIHGKDLERGFQSTHPHGVRLMTMEVIATIGKFQSTHPHGVRRVSAFSRSDACIFQSTHPHGVRHPPF